MTKGEETRQHIVERAAALFNVHGYAASSISDVMATTGLQKGGIYRHFDSKEQLALAAFDYAQAQYTARIEAWVQREEDALAQLIAFCRAFVSLTVDPLLPGGCPIMNALIETADGDPQLREHALQVVSDWEAIVRRIVARGIAQGVLRSDIDGQAVATMLIGAIEGAVMLSRAHHDYVYLEHAVEQLTRYLHTAVAREHS